MHTSNAKNLDGRMADPDSSQPKAPAPDVASAPIIAATLAADVRDVPLGRSDEFRIQPVRSFRIEEKSNQRAEANRSIAYAAPQAAEKRPLDELDDDGRGNAAREGDGEDTKGEERKRRRIEETYLRVAVGDVVDSEPLASESCVVRKERRPLSAAAVAASAAEEGSKSMVEPSAENADLMMPQNLTQKRPLVPVGVPSTNGKRDSEGGSILDGEVVSIDVAANGASLHEGEAKDQSEEEEASKPAALSEAFEIGAAAGAGSASISSDEISESSSSAAASASASASAATPDDYSSAAAAAASPAPCRPYTNPGSGPRWRTHQMAEDYISLAGDMMYPAVRLGPFGYDPAHGLYPIERVAALGVLTSPMRRPAVVEKWSPYEIAVFESALSLYGKHFHQVQRVVRTKTTKEIIEFYYIWKKTSHYKVWKRQYEPDIPTDNEQD